MDLADQRYVDKLRRLAVKKSRQVITSGGVEPVVDGGRDGHSLFAYYFLRALRENKRPAIDLENLFHSYVWRPVAEISGQTPGLGRLKTPMDEDGQFVLIKSARAVSELEAAVEALLSADPQAQKIQGGPDRSVLEQRAYEGLRESSNLARWQQFLKLFPEGAYAPVARQRIEILERQQALEGQKKKAAELERNRQVHAERERLLREARELDDQAFQTAQLIGTPDAFRQYMDQYPEGSHAAEARGQLARKPMPKAQPPATAPRRAKPTPAAQAPVTEPSAAKLTPKLQPPAAQPRAPKPEPPATKPTPKAEPPATEPPAAKPTRAWSSVQKAGSLERQAELAKDFLAQYPESEMVPRAHFILANHAYQANDYEGFVIHAEKNLEAFPANVALLVPLAMGYAERNESDKAIDRAQRALPALKTLKKPANLSEERWEANKRVYRADVHYSLGRAYLQKLSADSDASARDFNLRQSVTYLKKALEANPRHEYACYRLAFAYWQQKRFQESLELYARTVAHQGVASASARKELESKYPELHGDSKGLEQLIQDQRDALERKTESEAAPTPTRAPTLRRPGDKKPREK